LEEVFKLQRVFGRHTGRVARDYMIQSIQVHTPERRAKLEQQRYKLLLSMQKSKLQCLV
jgi:hypothetical protein